MDQPVLWHFTFSHFAEKVRWALDFKRVRHVRRALLPGLHYARVLWLSGQPRLPLLELDGRLIADSTAIIAALEAFEPDPPLYPGDESQRRRALMLEDFFDEELGHYVRRFLMHQGFYAPEWASRAAAFFAAGHGAAARTTFRTLAPAMRAFARWRFDVDAASAEVARGKILAAFDRIEAELEPSGYLVGDRFTVADLTAAALLSPIVRPQEFPYRAFASLEPVAGRDALTVRPAFRWVAEIYRRHRGTSVEVAT
jgi:glutathione S-transferase